MKTVPQVSDEKEYDVSDWCSIACCTKQKYILEPEFLLIQTTSNCCGNNTRRIPYGELSNIDKANCLCCVSVNGIAPGCGCEDALVTEIAAELQKRVGERGLTGQVQRSEDTVSLLRNLDSKLNRIEMKLDRILDDKMLR